MIAKTIRSKFSGLTNLGEGLFDIVHMPICL